MDYAEKYFKKYKRYSGTDTGWFLSEECAKRYGEYCRLEGERQVGLTDVRLAANEVLSRMAKEDGIV